MFIRAKTEEEVRDFKPDFTIINACKVTNPDWKAQKRHSDVFIAVNVEKVCACACVRCVLVRVCGVCLCVCVVCVVCECGEGVCVCACACACVREREEGNAGLSQPHSPVHWLR